jgi:small subunit ribosomal protein S17
MADLMKKPRKRLLARVVSNKMDKSVVVQVDRRVLHPVYKKYVSRSKKYMAHDAENQCEIGDRVLILQTAPISAHKRWTVLKVVEKAKKL